MSYGGPPTPNVTVWRNSSQSYQVGGITVSPNTLIGPNPCTPLAPQYMLNAPYLPSKEAIEAQIAALKVQLALFEVPTSDVQCPSCHVDPVAADDYVCGSCREGMYDV